MLQEPPIGIGSDDEAAGHRYLGPQHLAQVGALAADQGDIASAHFFECNNVSVVGHWFSLPCWWLSAVFCASVCRNGTRIIDRYTMVLSQ